MKNLLNWLLLAAGMFLTLAGVFATFSVAEKTVVKNEGKTWYTPWRSEFVVDNVAKPVIPGQRVPWLLLLAGVGLAATGGIGVMPRGEDKKETPKSSAP